MSSCLVIFLLIHADCRQGCVCVCWVWVNIPAGGTGTHTPQPGTEVDCSQVDWSDGGMNFGAASADMTAAFSLFTSHLDLSFETNS